MPIRKVAGKSRKSGSRQAGDARLSDTGIDVAVLMRDDTRPGAMSAEVLTTWGDGEKLFYEAVEGAESGWLVKGYEGELVATRTRGTRDESIRLVKVPLRTFRTV